jgi:hypothetical protein
MMGQLNFLGMEFVPIRTEDLEPLAGFLKRYPQPLTGYTFATLAAWHPFFHYRWTFGSPETLLVSCILDPDPHPHLLQPVGTFPEALAKTIVAEAAALNYSLKLIGVSDRFLKENPGFAQSFSVHEDRAVSNYVYSASALAQLRGRKYSKKRNLLSQATSLYTWTCRPLATPLLSSCFEVLDSIAEEERPVLEGMLERELAALECTLRHFEEFEQQGILISVDRRPVAFSIYEVINPKMVAIHFERALRSYKGLYQVVNWEAAKVIAAQGYEFINREEDLGDAGLRDAKLSYHPMEIVPAYELTFKQPSRLSKDGLHDSNFVL